MTKICISRLPSFDTFCNLIDCIAFIYAWLQICDGTYAKNEMVSLGGKKTFCFAQLSQILRTCGGIFRAMIQCCKV